MIRFQDYQQEAQETVLDEADNLSYMTLGLTNEAGEVAGSYKKFLRGDFDRDELRERLDDELGDVLWYLAGIAERVGLDLGMIAGRNIRKLARRKEGGTIRGDGSDR